MPLYEYECKQCKRHTEKIQKFSDPEITLCPHCGGELQRVITAPAIAFKGGGWFKDGYGNAKPAASGEKSGGDTAAAGSGSSDTSTSPKSDPAPGSPAATPAAPAAAAPAPATASSDKK